MNNLKTALTFGALLTLSTIAFATNDGGPMGGMASGGSGYAPNRAIIYEQVGAGPAFDNASYEQALELVNALFAKNEIALVRSLDLPEQSALGFCLQIKGTASLHDFIQLKNALDQIQPRIGSVRTHYDLSCD